tara:strand:- start:504 stop:710 length:207 start_codon:yes stop_codon:yes gene_type:complete
MRIIREVAPENIPLIIQAELGDEDHIDPKSIKVFPIVEDDEGGTFVLPELPVGMEILASRFDKYLPSK